MIPWRSARPRTRARSMALAKLLGRPAGAGGDGRAAFVGRTAPGGRHRSRAERGMGTAGGLFPSLGTHRTSR
jgi:hypothetical protein